jgi:predicted acylesterase/phospholipase RssA
MDGGLLNNLPLAFLSPEEIRDTWAVLFTSKPEGDPKQVKDIWDVARYIYDAAFLMKTKPFLEHYSDHIICVPTHDFSSVNFEITPEERTALIQRAGEQAKAFLKAGTARPPTRRYSIS